MVIRSFLTSRPIAFAESLIADTIFKLKANAGE